MTWAIVATILGLGAMAQAEFWAREWHDKKRRRAAAAKRLARIHAKREERERVRMRLEVAADVKEARERRDAAIKAGDVKAAARAVSDAHDLISAARYSGVTSYESPGTRVARRESAPLTENGAQAADLRAAGLNQAAWSREHGSLSSAQQRTHKLEVAAANARGVDTNSLLGTHAGTAPYERVR